MTRRCASAVVCSRSIASVANATAVSNPKQFVVPTMSLSIVFGTPTSGMPALAELVRDRERAVAADHDQRAEAHLVEHLDDAIGVIVRAFGGADGIGERIAAVRRAENRAAEPQDAGDVARREQARAIRLDEAVEAVFEADALDAAVRGGLHHGADDRVQTRRVTAAGEDAEPRNRRHRASVAGRPRCDPRNTCSTNDAASVFGRLAQLGERRVRNAEVGSSSLLPSTKSPK